MGSLMEYRRRILLNTPHLETASGSVAHFSTDMAAKLKECKVSFLPQQAGSGDPSPSNVRAISGWTSCDVVRSGKNLINDQTAVIYDRTTSPSGWSISNTAKSITLKVKSNSTYTISCDSSLAIFRGGTINIDPTTVSSSKVPLVTYVDSVSITGQRKFYTITTGTDDIWLIIQASGTQVTARTAQIQVELGSESTSYEPYQSNQITVSWADLGTIYGGFIDVLRGELVQEWESIASYNGETLPGEWLSDRDVYAQGATPTTGAHVVYKLATAVTYSFTAEVIKSLKGINNIFSDAGDVEVKFWTH